MRRIVTAQGGDARVVDDPMSVMARAPLVGGATMWAAGSVVVWTLVFGAGAMIMFKRDTARV